jgi:hypothetical protein
MPTYGWDLPYGNHAYYNLWTRPTPDFTFFPPGKLVVRFFQGFFGLCGLKSGHPYPVPEFIYRSFSAWKQAEYDRFWKRSFSQRDKHRSETWVVLGPFSACFKPHQTNMLVLEEKMKTTFTDSFQIKRAQKIIKMGIHFFSLNNLNQY